MNKLTGTDGTDQEKNCVRNPKTGRIDYCNSEYNDFPQFAYGYDNKMSPLCNENATATITAKLRSVYYVLRHSIKCSAATDGIQSTSQVKKQRSTNKLMKTLEKLNKPQGQFNNDENNNVINEQITWQPPASLPLQWSRKKLRKLHFDNEVKRTMSLNAQIHHEQFQSNNVIIDDDL